MIDEKEYYIANSTYHQGLFLFVNDKRDKSKGRS